ncbi:hypothetical protein NPIL_682871, partial [Nephila pilipes]
EHCKTKIRRQMTVFIQLMILLLPVKFIDFSNGWSS